MKGKKLAALVFFILLFLFPVLTFVLPQQTFSELENRVLEVFPKLNIQSVIDRSFMNGFESYVSDHFVGRDMWVSAKGDAEYARGRRENNGVFLCQNALIEHLDSPDMDITEKNIEGILAFQKDAGKTPYVMLIPSASEIQKQKLPRFAQTWDQKAYIDGVYEKLSETRTVDAYSALSEHSGEDIYYRTDHHWTMQGALLGYQSLMKAMGLPLKTPALIEVSDSFYGTLYSKAGYRRVLPDKMDAVKLSDGLVESVSVYNGKETARYASPYFSENLQKKDKYTYYLGENQPLVTIKTTAGTGRKLLVFKDSYAHCFAPLLLSQFDEIALVDLRYVNGGYRSLVDADGFTDVLMMYSVDVFSHQQNPAKLAQK